MKEDYNGPMAISYTIKNNLSFLQQSLTVNHL